MQQQWKLATLQFARLSEIERNHTLAVMDIVSQAEAFTLRVCLRLWFHCGACGEFQFPFEDDQADDVGVHLCWGCAPRQKQS